MSRKIVKSEAEWRQELTEEQYYVTRQKGTERAFTGELCDNKEQGVYRCVCCGSELFSSADQVRFAVRLAQLLAARRTRQGRRGARHQPRHGAHRSAVQPVRRPPRPRLPRRPPADRPALLHELSVTQIRARAGRRKLLNDERYLQIVLKRIRVSAEYRPKFGRGREDKGLSLDEFQALYGSDPFYSWFGLDNPLMYAAHKAAGGMTSVYRQIGIGCEELVRTILQDCLGLSVEDANWSYELPTSAGKTRKLHLDGRVILDKIGDEASRRRFHQWMKDSASLVNVDPDVSATLKGTVFEIRQGYKSKDSKRQNADIVNAANAYVQAYLPCALILSTQIDSDILLRYRARKWSILTGVIGASDPLSSTYDFLQEVVGYDLAGFFSRNQDTLKGEIDSILGKLLEPSP